MERNVKDCKGDIPLLRN